MCLNCRCIVLLARCFNLWREKVSRRKARQSCWWLPRSPQGCLRYQVQDGSFFGGSHQLRHKRVVLSYPWTARLASRCFDERRQLWLLQHDRGSWRRRIWSCWSLPRIRQRRYLLLVGSWSLVSRIRKYHNICACACVCDSKEVPAKLIISFSSFVL